MTTESHQIAALFAAGVGDWFPFSIEHADGRDAYADANAEGDVITIVVTDRLGRAKREYRAVIQLVAEDPRSGAPQ
jgi:hypothetical protein